MAMEKTSEHLHGVGTPLAMLDGMAPASIIAIP